MLWTPGQVLQASIGQSETAVTPLQMAVQASTLANKGKRYKPFLVDSINSYNMDKVIKQTQPEVASTIDIKYDKMYDYIEQGMIMASQSLTGENSLSNLPYKVAIKTGTPQKTADQTSSAFIGYYPVGNPEIAFAGMVENGEYSKYMIRKIIDAYYGYDEIAAANPSTTVSQSAVPAAVTTAPAAQVTATDNATPAPSTETSPITTETTLPIETPFVQNAQDNEDN